MTNLVNYRIYGENHSQPIYILHGIFGMLDNWHLAAQKLSQNYRVITFDARNHGKSFHDVDASYSAMVQDLRELMIHLGDASGIIMGHSMGGKTAMAFADQFPEMLDQLIVVDIAPKRYVPGHLGYFRAFKEVPLHLLNSRKEAEDAFLPYAPEMGVRQFLLKNIEPLPGGGYATKSNLEAIENHYDEIIGELVFQQVFLKQVDFIAGSKSGYIKESDKDGILQHFPTANFHVVDNAGHWVHAENLSGFLDCLMHILPSA
jgi:pimeloyl-ACP methyl ester carboxylesterase